MQADFKIIQPNDESLILSRNHLVQEQLRAKNPLFPVEHEYPIVLDQKMAMLSYCMMNDNNEVVAHANLWPRRFITGESSNQSYNVGLVGNVATDKRWQNKGLMRKLFGYLESIARKQNLDALILWSDLVQFYQNLGFSSLSREFRFHIERKSSAPGKTDLFMIDTKSVTIGDARKLLDIRYKVPFTLERSPEEFLQLLTIPATYLFIRLGREEIERYYLIGKGYDMVNVIHEWGCNNPVDLYNDVVDIGHELDFPSVTLLCPPTIEPSWIQTLKCLSATEETCSMAMIKYLNDTDSFREKLSQCFIWGPDSI
ncbi:MAG: GNAT family N-acetyltransferase [Oligoflexales bacterium]